MSLSANDKMDSSTPPIFIDNSTPKLHSSSASKPISVDSGRSITERPTIVDYGHDEAALSPAAEVYITPIFFQQKESHLIIFFSQSICES